MNVETWLLDDRDIRVEIYKGKKQGRQVWRWRLRAANNRIIASGGEAFANYSDAESSVRLVTGT